MSKKRDQDDHVVEKAPEAATKGTWKSYELFMNNGDLAGVLVGCLIVPDSWKLGETINGVMLKHVNVVAVDKRSDLANKEFVDNE